MPFYFDFTKPRCCLCRHRAPEVFSCDEYDEKCDVYSFGVMLLEMACVQPGVSTGLNVLFKGLSPFNIMKEVANGLRPELPEDLERECPLGLVALGVQCMLHDPAKRPSASECFTPSCQQTAKCVASLPVPAVVGTAKRGRSSAS